MFRFYLFAVIAVLTMHCFVPRDANSKEIINNCTITPQQLDLKMPYEFNKTNKLYRKAGDTEFAKGEYIVLQGVVLDQECAPISDAVVEIWQADAMGNEGDAMDSHFLGTGTNITDNEGRYAFYTVMPGIDKKNGLSKINIRVRHKDFLPLETAVYFENEAFNGFIGKMKSKIKGSEYKLLVAKEEKSIKNNSEVGIRYIFNIALEGTNLYKKY